MEQKKKTNKKFIIILSVLITVGAAYGIYKYIHSLSHEETDDAQITVNMNPIIPHIGGYIKKVYVSDNQIVKKGDTLFVIDKKDYNVQLQMAKANLVVAQSQVGVSEANIGSTKANVLTSVAQVNSASGNIETAKTQLWRANNDFERYENLYKTHTITTQQYEQALAKKQEAETRLNVLKSQEKATKGQQKAAISQTNISKQRVSVAQANVKSAEAAVEAAQLNLNYTVVTAPIDGQLSSVTLQAGQFVQPGQSLFYLVNTTEKWVIANFKETQLEKIEIGQKVSLKADAYPDIEFEGIVTNFSPATGAKFSLLPPDNATGNFVKTVQRLPIKIDFTQNNDPKLLQKLRSGMNVDVDIHLN